MKYLVLCMCGLVFVIRGSYNHPTSNAYDGIDEENRSSSNPDTSFSDDPRKDKTLIGGIVDVFKKTLFSEDSSPNPSTIHDTRISDGPKNTPFSANISDTSTNIIFDASEDRPTSFPENHRTDKTTVNSFFGAIKSIFYSDDSSTNNDTSDAPEDTSFSNDPLTNITVIKRILDASENTSLHENSSSNITLKRDIFDAMFETGSKYDLLKALEYVQIDHSYTRPHNFTVNFTESEKIVYYDITITPLNQFNDEHELKYSHFNNFTEIKLFMISNVLKIDGRFQTRKFNITTYGSFTIFLRGPKLVHTICPTETGFGIEQHEPHIQIDIENTPESTSPVAVTDQKDQTKIIKSGLESLIEDMTFEIQPNFSPRLIQNKIRQFKKAFPFIEDLSSPRLNTNHTVDDAFIKNLAQDDYSYKGLRSVVIKGLNNLAHVNIREYKIKPYILDRKLSYNITIATGALEVIYKFHEEDEKRFSVDNLTLSIRPFPGNHPSRFSYIYESYIGQISDESVKLFHSDYENIAVKFSSIGNSSTDDSRMSDLLRTLENYFISLLRSRYDLQENPLDVSLKKIPS